MILLMFFVKKNVQEIRTTSLTDETWLKPFLKTEAITW